MAICSFCVERLQKSPEYGFAGGASAVLPGALIESVKKNIAVDKIAVFSIPFSFAAIGLLGSTTW